ncbi:hypothetical protein M3223_07430 [Paenibacillus pasadenensis]|uniref:hypothetical protein n=1 Tax=Paenibacillus pasadenensis TaxID=217090 RepID=UPI002041EA1A|nr:hypothetical protein [Paenibacillus pasadenensis]MCM3747186.1 hypothetical protein [Paenibacillus pasadenensis]
MICPEDFTMMNESEHNGVTMNKCPVCGTVILEDKKGRLPTGGDELYPAAADGQELKLMDKPYGMPPGAADRELQAAASADSPPATEQAYGSPPVPQPPADNPYGYVPEGFGSASGAAADSSSEPAYGEAPAFGAKAPGEQRDGSGPVLRAHRYYVV